MTARMLWPTILFAFAMSLGCRSPEGASGSMANAPALAPTTPAATPANPHALLDRLDTRTPVPLVPMMANHQKQNMRDHLAVVQEIVTAVASNDFAAIESSISRIGYSEQMGMMCTHMGAGATGFTEAALKFHHTADTIAEAARQKDAHGVLTALSATLTTCTTCHATFKQQVVDDVTWTAVTKQPTPTGAMHHP